MAYTIKRYANRKLYDPQESRYVTLEELAALIRQGNDVRVLNASSGGDVTAMVLAQVFVEQERTGQAALPAAFLQQLIKHGQAWQAFLQQALTTSLEGVVGSQRELDRIVREWAARSGLFPASPTRTSVAGSPPPSPEQADLREEVAALQRQVRALERQLPRKRIRPKQPKRK